MAFTGTKRLRGTRTAPAPSNTSMAAPIAVSSCTTAGDDESFGSTVLRFTIIGSSTTPPLSPSTPASARRFTQIVLVLK